MTWRGPQEFARDQDPLIRWLRGSLRRMAIKLTSGTLWQLLGQRGGTGGDEVVHIEIFPGIGFYARPPLSGKPEAICAAPGGPKGLAAIAMRDEKTRQKLFKAAGELAEDETAIHNSVALVVVKADGTIEARTAGGNAVSLALKSDVEAVDAKYASHIHLASDGGSVTGGPLTAGTVLPNPAFPPTPPHFLPGAPLAGATIVGTSVLKGE